MGLDFSVHLCCVLNGVVAATLDFSFLMAINSVSPEDTTWISAPSCLLFEKLKSEGHLFDWVTGGWAWKLLLRFQLLRICIVAQVFLAFPQGNGASCYIEEAFCL